ncbi:hypothetical protein L228DRAFT_246117 [Xylona heveae TC161]|uniref:LYR motif-containing protein Cup1-like N-terminal domain-containing protein n=1 Tax=Xylona heveae (strain CBS 132557 / TC161) TaxID=1328760 RepID=A0A165HDR3_XYLHT|nr:hypothetical protein L228DRAFT_246117 [Xylona heveae TC161]KZF23353.1 hypothetical protein L228DRAFT_246117 [Xylona heveae TC161]
MVVRASSHPLHLLRSLLRECTYLPDPAARTYFHQYILQRFRKHTQENQSAASDSVRITQLLRSARRGLSVLQRANNGELKHLQKVLMHTYGRSGKRRRELLAEVSQSDIPADQNALETVRNNAQNKASGFTPSTRLLALAKSHQKRPSAELGKSSIKRLSPKIPETNIWGRRFPECRARNMRRKWFAGLLEKIQPPLPRHEWDRLCALATGKQKIFPFEMPQRRSCLNASDSSALAKVASWRTGASPFYPKKDMIEQPHVLTSRFMRRLWARIFMQTPTMSQDLSGKEWRVEWGSVHDGRIQLKRATSPSTLSLFEGVDEKGIKQKSPKS